MPAGMLALALLSQDPSVVAVAPAEDNMALVTLNCALQPDGSLADCRIITETPADQGFGEEAIENSRRARVRLPEGATEHPPGRVQFNTRFQLPPPNVVIALPNRRR
jgi:hypothetical protein